MPIYKKLPKTKAKKPDEFISFFDRLYHKAYERGPAVIAVLLVVAIVGFGILFWRGYHARRDEKTSEKLFLAAEKGKEERAAVLKDIKKANLYGPMGVWASLELANQEAAAGDCDGVIAELESYSGRSENPVLKSLIDLRLGACLEDKKEWQKAAKVYDSCRFDSKNDLKDWCALRLASVKKNLGDGDESKKILDQLLKNPSAGTDSSPTTAPSTESPDVSSPVREEARLTELGF